MHYYLYEIRNNINNKIYVGVHKTKVLDDGYMGSGKIIKAAVIKYGAENFTKTILEIFETQEEMFSREMEIVNEEFLNRDDTYNLRRGGTGGFDYVNKNIDKIERIRRGKIGGKAYAEKYGSPATEEGNAKGLKIRREESKGSWNNKELRDIANKKSQSKEARAKRIKTFEEIQHQSGEKNSQFGSMWITNGKESKKIRKDESIPVGWYNGRKQKHASLI